MRDRAPVSARASAKVELITLFSEPKTNPRRPPVDNAQLIDYTSQMYTPLNARGFRKQNDFGMPAFLLRLPGTVTPEVDE